MISNYFSKRTDQKVLSRFYIFILTKPKISAYLTTDSTLNSYNTCQHNTYTPTTLRLSMNSRFNNKKWKGLFGWWFDGCAIDVLWWESRDEWWLWWLMRYDMNLHDDCLIDEDSQSMLWGSTLICCHCCFSDYYHIIFGDIYCILFT